jgi:hypothetical protein
MIGVKKCVSMVFGLIFLGTMCMPATAGASFNPNRLVDDSVFSYTYSMNAAQIDAFLNARSQSCISQNSGFEARLPSGYSPSSGFNFGGFTSAGQVIATAAQVYGINPQVLIVTLEKEQSLVTGRNNFGGYCNNGDEHKYASAVGYGCPDGGTVYNWSNVSLYRRGGVERTVTGQTCVNSASKAGFSQQVIRAAWLLKFGQQRSLGNINWAIVRDTWDNSDDPQSCYGGPVTQGERQVCPSSPSAYYDGYRTIDGQSVHMDTGATAALYWYTPHFSGNQNFVSLFESWFGSTQTTIPYAWLPTLNITYADAARTAAYSPSAAISITPGGTAYVRVKALNNGNQVWTQSTSRLGTTDPQDRLSSFADSSWVNGARIAMQETSVTPGDEGTFLFNLKAPVTPGSYTECFKTVADGITWMVGPTMCMNMDVVTSEESNDQNLSLEPGQLLAKGSYIMSPAAHSALVMQPDGNLVLYSDSVSKWNTGTGGTGAHHLIMQTDGNLVLYDKVGQPKWFSGTGGNPNARAVLQSDGNLVLYSSNGVPIWSTLTNSIPSYSHTVLHSLNSGVLLPQQSLQTANRKRKLLMQRDGNIVLYSSGKPVWTPLTQGNPGATAVMQADGNLVVYSNSGRPLWASFTHNHPGARLVLQDDGNLVIYSAGNVPIWQSFTLGR